MSFGRFPSLARRAFSVGSPSAPRSVIVAGMRTPFCKSYGELMHMNSVDLGNACIASLINKVKLNPREVEQIMWGNVVLDPVRPNVAREINIALNMPGTVVSHQLSMQCLTGLKAILDADVMIRDGHADCIIAGGSDSVSFSQVCLPMGLTQGLAMTVYGGGKTLQRKAELFWKYSGPMSKWMPTMPSVAEPSTGNTMGVHVDHMAEMWKIPRARQDEYTAWTHTRAAEARKRGVYDEEIAPLTSFKGGPLKYDNFLQEPNMEKMSKLKPAFRKAKGTVTAANSTGLSDGGSAVLLTSEAYAKRNGWPTDMVIKAWCNTGVDPWPQLLIAPAVAIPLVLDRAGLTLGDIDVIEMHEAFAAQVLATLAAINSQEFMNMHVKGHKPLGEVDMARLNVNGGSLAIGHPFAATGGRCVTAAMNELRRSKKRYALISICAAGGLGSTAILERLDELSAQPAASTLQSKS